MFGAGALKSRSTLSSGHGSAGSACVVFLLPRVTPCYTKGYSIGPIFAQSRFPIEVMTSGFAMRLFQAWHPASRMAPYGFEDAICEPCLSEVLPDILNGVQFRRFRRNEYQRQVLGNVESSGCVPRGLVHEDDSMCAGYNRAADLSQM